MVEELRARGLRVNRKRVQRLRRLMRIESVAPKPSTSQPKEEHEKYPYLLRNLPIVRHNQVWATDITYIPLAHGFAYLVAVIDWYSRKVLAWRLSNTLDDAFCVEALQAALATYGRPEIFNSDHEDVYLRCYATLDEARRGIAAFLHHYNAQRRRQALGNDTPDAVYARPVPTITPITSRHESPNVANASLPLVA